MVYRYRVFRMFGNKLWGMILGHGRELMTGGWRILYMEEIDDFTLQKKIY
jgi:hypothetical protein